MASTSGGKEAEGLMPLMKLMRLMKLIRFTVAGNATGE